MTDFEKKVNYYIDYFNLELNKYVENLYQCSNKLIVDAMSYTLNAGGKRLRPVLGFLFNELLGGDNEKILPYLLAIEMIHTYSLIHDDLPAMDNDDFRRGKPSNHKKFGEGIAILAGDALLNQAIELVVDKTKEQCDIEAMRVLFSASGINGMIGGQVLDIISENAETFDEKTLNYIQVNKTAKLIQAPILIASILNKRACFDELKIFGEKLGVLFQICDDILDEESTFEDLGKTVGKDEKSNKLTSIKIYGKLGAKRLAESYYNDCKNVLLPIPNSEILVEYLDKVYKRTR